MQSVLIIADKRELHEWMEGWSELAPSQARLSTATDTVQAERMLLSGRFDCVCCDLEKLGFEEGQALQRRMLERTPGPGGEWIWIVPPGLPPDRTE